MSKNKEKKVYIGMSADLIHPGHLKIIQKGNSLGTVIIGLLTDEAIETYKDSLPTLSFEERREVIQHIKGVDEVVAQNTLDYTDNLEKIKPDYVVHGDDWKTGVQLHARNKVIETLSQWGGELIELPYTKRISSTIIKEKIRKG